MIDRLLHLRENKTNTKDQSCTGLFGTDTGHWTRDRRVQAFGFNATK